MANAADMNSMRVDQRNLTGAAAAEAGGAQESQSIGRAARAARRPIGRFGSDQVELSSLSHALNASASSRTSRVDQLTAQYQAGQYQPDPVDTSKSMVSEALAAGRWSLA